MKPIAADLYCGLGGWAEGFLSEGYDVIGYDIEAHDYGTGGYPGKLVLQDARTLRGQGLPHLDRLAVIVASPPCTEYSYMAMPWKRAKQIAAALRGQGPFPAGYKGSRSIEELNTLFDACFRIQREASEAAGRYIPLIVENVRGALPWVTQPVKWHHGSYFLWGDVPALMPVTLRAQKVPGFRFDGSGKSFQSASVKVAGQDWSRFAKTGEKSPHWRMEAHRDDEAGVKRRNRGTQGWFGEYKPTGQGSRNFSSNNQKRKAASALIAKIPFPLAVHIARCFKP
jgi:hypothetical protein